MRDSEDSIQWLLNQTHTSIPGEAGSDRSPKSTPSYGGSPHRNMAASSPSFKIEGSTASRATRPTPTAPPQVTRSARSGWWQRLFGRRSRRRSARTVLPSTRTASAQFSPERPAFNGATPRKLDLPAPPRSAVVSMADRRRPQLVLAPLRSERNNDYRDRHPATSLPATRRTRQNRPGLQSVSPGASLAELRYRHKPRQPIAKPMPPQPLGVKMALYTARMVILSVGLGVLAGTVLSVWDPAMNASLETAQLGVQKASSVAGKVAPIKPSPAVAASTEIGQEVVPLKAALQALVQKYPDFSPGIFLLDLDNNSYVDLRGTGSYAAASTIKVPILVAFFQDVDAGKIRLDEPLTMRPELIAKGSGDMQYLTPGTKFTALETATKMITISDNTATNMLIARMGGIGVLNQRFKAWGLASTTLNNLLPDLEGTNVTSPKDLSMLMVRVSHGELITPRSRDRMLDIMRRTINNSQLPQGLGEGAIIAHKTGDIGSLIGDVGLVDLPSGKRYSVTVLIKRQHNDDNAYDVAQQISRVIYQHLTRPVTTTRPTSAAEQPLATGSTALQSE